jgi:hypothetical protein
MVPADEAKMAHPDDDAGGGKRDGCTMNSQAQNFAYISSDVPDAVTLREYGRIVAAASSTGDSRLKRALHGLRLGDGPLRRPAPRLRLA